MAKYDNGELRYNCKCGKSLLQCEFQATSTDIVFIDQEPGTRCFVCPRCARFIPNVVDNVRLHEGGSYSTFSKVD